MASMTSEQWATGLLEALQKAGENVKVTPNNIANIQRMIGVESSGNQAGFMRDNNPWNLNTYTSAHSSLPGGHIVNEWGVNVQVFNSVEAGYAAYVNQFKSNPSILTAFKKNASAADFGTALSQSGWSSGHYANAATFATVAPYTGSGTAASGAAGRGATTPAGGGGVVGAVNIPAAPNIPPMKGVNIKNFHGYDLSAFANAPDLGKVEQTIQKYVIDPGYRAQLDHKLATEYGYQTNWWKNIPEVNAVMLYAAVEWDPTVAAGQNAFQSALANTNWWKTSTSNARYWDEAYGTNGGQGTDPAQAQQALENAQEKVLAVANQIGVNLTKQQLDQIAMTYAKNNYVASGSFGTASGTAPDWLDQAVVDTIYNIQGQNLGKIPTDFSTLAPGSNNYNPLGTAPAAGTTNNQAPGAGQNPTGMFGISAQLYQQFQQIAQQYLLYNPTSTTGGLMTNQTLMNWVQQTLQNYTGSGASFGSSNLIQGAISQFTEFAKNTASQMYPGLAASITQGITPQNYAAQYTQLISSALGVNPASIDYTSPKWNWVLNTPDAKTGVKTPMTLDQVQQKIVHTDQWQNSNNAQQMSNDVAVSLNKQFGFGGT